MQKGLILATLMAAGCSNQPATMGLMMPAEFVASSDGRILPAAIEITDDKGKLMATDPRTGERFSGTYVSVPVRKGALRRVAGLFSAKPAGRPAPFRGRSTGSAVLVGNRGGRLKVTMTIRGGIPAHGFGQAVDKWGRSYVLRF